MMSPRPQEDRGGGSSLHNSAIPFRHTPLQIVHTIGTFGRIGSVYSMFWYLSQTGASVVLFIMSCLVPASILFLVLQKPWKGRPLANTQVVPSIINGGITALYFILWGKGLKSCGPLRAIMAEYSGAALGVLSAMLFVCLFDEVTLRRELREVCNYYTDLHFLNYLDRQILDPIKSPWVGGLIAMLASFYFLSQGWATATHSPFSFKDGCDSESQSERILGMTDMAIPIFAGILFALRRVIARRVSLKNQFKRRLHAITLASATCFMFPVAMWDFLIGSNSNSDVELPFSAWAFFSTFIFGLVLTFYVDNIAEDRLHMVFSSPRHLIAAGGSIIVMEILYKTDFSLLGFLICSIILGFGIYGATSLEHSRKESSQKEDQSNGVFSEPMQMSPLPT